MPNRGPGACPVSRGEEAPPCGQWGDEAIDGLDQLLHVDRLGDDAFGSLTPQEDRILEMIADGLTNGAIFDRLSLAEKTVKDYVSQIYARLSVEHRSQAVQLVTEHRLRKRR